MATVCGDRICAICGENLFSPSDNVNVTDSNDEKITDVFRNSSSKTNNLTQVFLQCLGDGEDFNDDDLGPDNFDSDEDEAQVIFCTKCQNYLTRWNDLNSQVNLLQLQASQIKFTLCAMILMSMEKFEDPAAADDDTSLKPLGEETAEEQQSLKNLVQIIRNCIFKRFNVQVLLRKTPLLQAESCKPAVAATRPQLTCVTIATDKYVYADKYAFVFQGEKFRCAECSAARAKKCDMLRHIRVKHIDNPEFKSTKSRVKIRVDKMDLNATKTEGHKGPLESEECDLDEPEADCPRLRQRSSVPSFDVIDIDSNDFQDDAGDDWNESISDGSDAEVEQKAKNKSRSQNHSSSNPKVSRIFRPKRGYYTPTEDGSVMDPYGHVLQQTGPNEYLYANEYKFSFQDEKYHCDVCKSSILKRCQMLKHIRLKHINPKENEFKSRFSRFRPIGPDKYLYMAKFRVTVTPNGKWKCDECQVERNREKDIRYHIRRLHMEKRPKKSDKIQGYSCKEVRPDEYLYHDKFPFRFDTKEGMYVCGICDHKSSLRGSMLPHIRTNHFTEEETRLHSAVEVAPGEFLYAGKYKIFFSDGRYACGICGCVKEVIWDLYPHMKKFHLPGSNPFETPVAMETKEVANMDEAKADAALGTTDLAGKIPEAFTASMGVVTSDGQQESVPVAQIKKMPANLPPPDPITGRIDLEHMGIPFSYESTINKWTCSLCPIVKAYRNKLTEHIRRKHINPERFVCDICGLEASDRSVFRKHQARHQGARFKCHLCDKQFADRAYLRTHLNIHKGEEAKKFQCEFCGRKFHSKKQYSNHVPTHTGEKPFPCDICGERFSNTFKRREHSKAVHGGVPQPMKIAYFERKTQPVTNNNLSSGDQLSLTSEQIV